MTRHGLARRLNRIERDLAPQNDLRIVLRFDGPGTEHFPKPTEEESGDIVLTIVSVPARDGRPA